jgi:hypothetical protein
MLTMHTYLPYSNASINTAILSEVDLSQQIRAGLTILETLHGRDKGWQWHPAIGMWNGFEEMLAQRIVQLGIEWVNQGFRDTFNISGRLESMGYDLRYLRSQNVSTPWWWGDKPFHAAQRAALVRHDRSWYAPIFKGKVDGGLPELWPLAEQGKYKIGPQPSPDGKFDYRVDGKPLFPEARKMDDVTFLFHINNFHRLLGNKRPIKARDADIFPMLRSLHDRFHSMRFYNSHDHAR